MTDGLPRRAAAAAKTGDEAASAALTSGTMGNVEATAQAGRGCPAFQTDKESEAVRKRSDRDPMDCRRARVGPSERFGIYSMVISFR